MNGETQQPLTTSELILEKILLDNDNPEEQDKIMNEVIQGLINHRQNKLAFAKESLHIAETAVEAAHGWMPNKNVKTEDISR